RKVSCGFPNSILGLDMLEQKTPANQDWNEAMSEAVVDDIVAVLPPLLQSLEALGFVARHLYPPEFDGVMQAAGTPDDALRAVRGKLAEWPADLPDLRTPPQAA